MGACDTANPLISVLIGPFEAGATWAFDLLESVSVPDITGTCPFSSNLIINSHSTAYLIADNPLSLSLLKLLSVITK